MGFRLDKEREFLDSLVADYKDQSPYSKAKKDVIHELIKARIADATSKRVLQLGCSGGYETNFLADTFGELDVIDGSSSFIDEMKAKNTKKNINFIYSLFEDYPFAEETYDYIFCNYILEHVYDPVQVLENVKPSLKKDGTIFVTVPNRNAFSRQLALQMGLITDLKGLTENDHIHGHRRTYDSTEIARDFKEAGFTVQDTQGVIFKILADFQLNKMFEVGIISDEHIKGLQAMATINNDYCDSIFVVATR